MSLFQLRFGDSPIVAVALHDGHAVRPEVAARMAIGPAERLREEDPYTGAWTAIAPTRIVAMRSRFEVDLNRPRYGAIYRRPEQAWGLTVWREPLPEETALVTLAEYDDFYAAVQNVLERLVARHGRVVVFDLHTYNHRRGGPVAPAADPAENPDIDLGTHEPTRRHWGWIADRFLAEMRSNSVLGRRLTVGENVRFDGGGHFSVWLCETFPQSVCCLSVEVKKFFMDEWTGELNEVKHAAVQRALERAAKGVEEAIG